MNVPSPEMLPRRHRERAIVLIDCLIYIAMFFVITGVAFEVFYRTFENSRLVTRSAQDIAGAIQAGERWRDDVRQASAPLRLEDTITGGTVLIPLKSGSIRYRFSENALWRQVDGGANWTRVLEGVKSSRMAPDNRPQAAAWRWELELKPRAKSPRVLPLFTFEAVPAAATTP